MGGIDGRFSDRSEPTVRYHSEEARILIGDLESGSLTVSDGQFVWGEFLKAGLSNWKITFELGYMLEPLFLQLNSFTLMLPKFNCKDANYKITLFIQR